MAFVVEVGTTKDDYTTLIIQLLRETNSEWEISEGDIRFLYAINI